MLKKAIKVRNVSKIIGKKKVLDNINFDIYEGEKVGIVGKYGSGKTTLLKVMSGLYSMDEGNIFYYDVDLEKNYEKAMSIIGNLLETPDVYKDLNNKNNLELFKKMFKGVDEESIKGIVKIVEMEKHLGKKFKTNTLGMKERLGIANSLINKPKILILDEPFLGLDSSEKINVFKTLKSLNDTTVLIATNNLNEIEGLCNKIIFINDGKIENINIIENNNKKNVTFEVDDFSKARLLMNDYCINENLEVYETDEKISEINKELMLNNINVYRIYDSNNTLEKDFYNIAKQN